MLMVTPLDYYLHNSTFITPPQRAGQMSKNKGKSLPVREASVKVNNVVGRRSILGLDSKGY